MNDNSNERSIGSISSRNRAVIVVEKEVWVAARKELIWIKVVVEELVVVKVLLVVAT